MPALNMLSRRPVFAAIAVRMRVPATPPYYRGQFAAQSSVDLRKSFRQLDQSYLGIGSISSISLRDCSHTRDRRTGPSRSRPSQSGLGRCSVVAPSHHHPYQVDPLRALSPSTGRSGCRLPPGSAARPHADHHSTARDIDAQRAVGSRARLRVEAATIRKSAISYGVRNPISTDGERGTYRLSCIEIARLQLHNAEELLALDIIWFSIEYPPCEASG